MQKHYLHKIPLKTSQHTNKDQTAESIKQIQSSDLDLFLKIMTLIQKHYIKCTNNLERVKATILIVKELEDDL